MSLNTLGIIKNGTKIKIPAVFVPPQGYHLTGLRFKNLGTSFTAEQATAIANGDFSEFWNGDYWTDTSQNIIWRIVDNTDYMLRKGDTEFTAHGLIVMPDDPLVMSPINATKTTSGGYAGTTYRSTHRATAKTKVANFFGNGHIGTHREIISTAVSGGKASGWGFYDCDVEIPAEVNIYGHNAFSAYSDGGCAFNIGLNWGQFRLFSLAPYMAINRSYGYFLRDVNTADGYSACTNSGIATSTSANADGSYLRPFFVLV